METIGQVIGSDMYGRTWVRTVDGRDLPLPRQPRKRWSLLRRVRLQRTAAILLVVLVALAGLMS